MKFNKKGAMFGLDARIALAIFGALSVISGAALYSAIQQAKVVQWQTYFNELSKASEAYYLDTGSEIPFTANTSYDTERLWLSIMNLVLNQNSVSGWQGPYWQATDYSTVATNDHYFKDVMTNSIVSYTLIRLTLRQTSTWDTSIDTNANTNELCVLNSTDCAEWWALNGGAGGPSELLKIYSLLDEAIDGGDGAYTGNVRYSTYSSDFLFVKGRPRIYRGV